MSTPIVKGETPLHRSIVSALIRHFQGQGFEIVAAAASGYAEPAAHGRHEPDVVGRRKDGVLVLGEAKTGEGDLNTEHSREQYQDFANRVMTTSHVPCPFYLCVPRAEEGTAKAILRELGVLGKTHVTVLVYG